MRVTVVIATYNRRDALHRLLRGLARQSFPPDEMEIVVAVDGSIDGTLEMLDALDVPCRLYVVSQENAGQAAARNAGWRAGSGDVVLFLDDDLEAPPGLVAAHAARHEELTDGVVVGRVRLEAEGRPSVAFEIIRDLGLQWERRVTTDGRLRWPEDAYVATNSSVARGLLESTGGFDPEFYRALEDHELGLRLWAGGGHFVYAPEAEVTQRYDKSTARATQDERWYGAAEVLLAAKHPAVIHHTLAARVDTLSRSKKSAVRLLVSLHGLTKLLIGVPVQVADRAHGWPGVRRFARRLAWTWMHTTRLRATLDALGGWREFDRRFSGSVAALMYHHVGPPRAGTYPDLTVDPGTFERQIATLARKGYRGLTPNEYLAMRHGEVHVPQKAVLITFDDGYEEIDRYALPVLERFGFGCCVYIVTGELAGTNAWDEVDGSATHRLLDAEQIRQWQAKGVEFGGHSVRHPSLPTLDRSGIRSEVAGCAGDLGQVTGRAPRTFAYPYGDFDDRVVDEVRRVYDLTFTTIEGLNHPGTDPHLLRRTMVLPTDSGSDVGVRARLGYHPRDVWLRWRARSMAPVRSLVRALFARA